MYMISSRPTTPAEAAAIRQHLDDYPKCDGTQMVDDDDRTFLGMKRQLQYLDCRVKVTVRE